MNESRVYGSVHELYLDKPKVRNILREAKGIVYRIRNIINGKAYIGKAQNSFFRRYRHGRWWKFSNDALRSDFEKYGEESFDVTIMAEGLSPEEAIDCELFLIASHNSLFPNGYNLVFYSKENSKISEFTRTKMSISQKGRKATTLGYKHTAETRKFLSDIAKGRKPTSASNLKRSISESGVNNHFFGKHHSEKTKQEISLKKTGIPIYKNMRSVMQLDKNSNLIIKKYQSIKEASISTGLSRESIGHACAGSAKTSGGFKWKYINETT